MKTNQKLIDFISKIEGKMLKENAETVILSNQLESSVFGGKNRGCSNVDDNCNKSKNKNCTNYNKTGCKDSTNKRTCSNTKPG
ncbi:hypothetical protein [Empedobacter brevis]|uniref:hypothetical protein n=1 Tax=Empedobacter brevis TaxID=247 RepID=UPI0028ACCE4A|nr:hypothetical protein [Empedobacter brevis]